MADSKQDRALASANSAMAISQQLSALRASINQYMTQFSSEQYADIWEQLQTVPLNADGSLGTNPDTTPNNNNPINAPHYPGLNRAVTPQNLVDAVNMFVQLQNFFTNQAVTSGNYNTVIDHLTA